MFHHNVSVRLGEISNLNMIFGPVRCDYLWTLDRKEKIIRSVNNGNLVNIRARVLLIILWALHEYFIHLRAPAGVWIMQLVSSWGKRTVAEPPKLNDVLMQPQTTH